MTETQSEYIRSIALTCVNNCINEIQSTELGVQLSVTRLESLLPALEMDPSARGLPRIDRIQHLIQHAMLILIDSLEFRDNAHSIVRAGRPTLNIPFELVESLISMKFNSNQVAKMFGVSVKTINRRLKQHGLSMRTLYSQLTDDELEVIVTDIRMGFPNTGYKRMKGFLSQRGVIVTDRRVRQVMRSVDTEGVASRRSQNRAIVRRQYFVEYSNQLWHIDTNLKLIRWKIVVRGGIDGKNRTCVYMDAGVENSAESNLIAFLKGVDQYGIPLRIRSDKGGENVLVARYMLKNRGLNRGSHICGRSVHNQRIERFWRDVFSGCLGFYYSVFSKLEDDGVLDIENDYHLFVLHKIFIPRLNNHLMTFKDGWNLHPLSSKHNLSPRQIMFTTLPPSHLDIGTSQEDSETVDFVCNSQNDLTRFSAKVDEDSATNPTPVHILGETLLSEFVDCSIENTRTDSELFGYNIFCQVMTELNMQTWSSTNLQ